MEFFRGTYTAMKLTKLFVNLPIYLANLYYWITRNPERKVTKNVLKNWNVKLPFPLEDLKKMLLLWQINSHLKKVRVLLYDHLAPKTRCGFPYKRIW